MFVELYYRCSRDVWSWSRHWEYAIHSVWQAPYRHKLLSHVFIHWPIIQSPYVARLLLKFHK